MMMVGDVSAWSVQGECDDETNSLVVLYTHSGQVISMQRCSQSDNEIFRSIVDSIQVETTSLLCYI